MLIICFCDIIFPEKAAAIYYLNNKKIVIVHGKGTGTLRKRIREYLSKDKRVKKYYQDNFNDGMTIVEL